MGRSNLGLVLTSISELPIAKLLRAAPSNSVGRLMSTSFQQSKAHHHQENSEKEIKERAEENLKSEDGAGEKEEEEEDDDDGEFVNKETGEVGGPRGPEPTRYGDWERGGRCSDF